MFINNKQNVVWGGLLILFGVVSLLELYFNIGAWGWVLVLAAAGIGTLGIYALDRSNISILIISYSLFAIALMLALINLDFLRDEAIATYVLTAIAAPFVIGYYQTGRKNGGLLIPAYILFSVGLMVGLIGMNILQGLLIASYVLIAISIPFFAAYLRNRSNGAFLIPGGITAFIGLSFLMASAAQYIAPLVLIGAGLLILLRQLRPKAAIDG
jgi:hypothetical protein